MCTELQIANFKVFSSSNFLEFTLKEEEGLKMHLSGPFWDSICEKVRRNDNNQNKQSVCLLEQFAGKKGSLKAFGDPTEFCSITQNYDPTHKKVQLLEPHIFQLGSQMSSDFMRKRNVLLL